MNRFVPIPPDKDRRILGLFTADKYFYKTFFPLLMIITLQQLAALTVNLVDNVMLGSYTELALSGATLVNQLQFTLQQVSVAIGLGVTVLSAQYWGKREIEPIKKIISVGVKIGLLAGIIFFFVSLLIPEAVLGLFTNDAAVITEGIKYLQIICFTYLIFALSNTLVYALQSVETAGVGLVMSLVTICINLCLNYIFIFGNLGAPEMGIRGAAVATLISRSTELAIVLIYMLFKDRKLRMKLKEIFGFDMTYFKDYIKVSTPLIANGLMWGVAQAAQTSVLGHIGAQMLAANGVALIIFSIFAVMAGAATSASSIVTGKIIGEKKFDKLRSYVRSMQLINIIMGIFFGLMIFIFKSLIVGAFSSVSPGTRDLAVNFLTILSVTTVGTFYEFPASGGIIAGGGSTRYAPLVDNIFMWCFTIPASILSAFVFKLPPEVTFMFLKADQLLKCIPNGIVLNRYRWVRVLTRGN